jgi:hypothetical protein
MRQPVDAADFRQIVEVKRGRPTLISAEELGLLRRSTTRRSRRKRRSLQDQYYARRAIRVLCQQTEHVPRTYITRAAESRWPWLFPRVPRPKGQIKRRAGAFIPSGAAVGIYSRKRSTILAALGRCPVASMPGFADQLCRLKPSAAEGAKLIRSWRQSQPKLRADPNPRRKSQSRAQVAEITQ